MLIYLLKRQPKMSITITKKEIYIYLPVFVLKLFFKNAK